MSKSANHVPTPDDSVVRNTAGNGSKQTPDDPPGFMPNDKLREFCDKHYNQLLPLMAEKVHQGNFQWKEKIQKEAKAQPIPSTMSKSSYPSQSLSVFSRLKRGDLGAFPLRREEKSLIYNTSFLGKYECSSLALDRGRKKVEDEIGSLEIRLNYVSDQENSAVFIASKWKRLLTVVLAVLDIFGGRHAYQEAAPRSSRSIHDIIKKGIGWLMRGCVIRGNRVFDGAFGGDEDEDFVIGEGVVVSSYSLVKSTKSCLGGMMVSLIFLEGLEEEAWMEAMGVEEK
ncbi:hypothetical protein Tco_0840472 [Tanacetum coccineum]|uniref:Uncharacterized protein n=1 Tax=Tanacetum coccineum TaxID=301880 RepID=A0ABQ5ATN2_9ASTR